LVISQYFVVFSDNICATFVAGLDGCFVKLTTGQQILVATGRDGNNNIYPIAFGLVDKEDKASWTWFLNQLKAAIGEVHPKFGPYTIISDSRRYFQLQLLLIVSILDARLPNLSECMNLCDALS